MPLMGQASYLFTEAANIASVQRCLIQQGYELRRIGDFKILLDRSIENRILTGSAVKTPHHLLQGTEGDPKSTSFVTEEITPATNAGGLLLL